LQRYAQENKKRSMKFTTAALHALENHQWPGNIRELENRIKRAVIMAEGTQITPVHLELVEPVDPYAGKRLKEAREVLERDLVQRALVRSKGNLTQAAADLGVSRPTLYELIDKLGIAKG
jgi:two-component system NtrC family response regulator